MIEGFDEGLPSLFLVVFRAWRGAVRVCLWTFSSAPQAHARVFDACVVGVQSNPCA